MQSHEQPDPRRTAEGRESKPDTADEQAPAPWPLLLGGLWAHLLCYGAAACAMFIAVLLTWNDQPGGPPRALPWIGLTYWLAGGIVVWWLWGRRPRTIVPIFASTLATMFLVSVDFGHHFPFVASRPDLQWFLRGLALSTLPIAVSWLAVQGPRWRTRLIHVAAILAAIAGGVVCFAWPSYHSFWRLLINR
ncbi:hypothetical protein [uncultured Tessaracoccus sp.]|uniref:hypothetical protein n=1 Tax=uncultured Tessaracoccus sp. TaxID=905023 RepID=UPI0025E895FA|nr:hypothetical protein [uncultured Tessaracoccus sp.]